MMSSVEVLSHGAFQWTEPLLLTVHAQMSHVYDADASSMPPLDPQTVKTVMRFLEHARVTLVREALATAPPSDTLFAQEAILAGSTPTLTDESVLAGRRAEIVETTLCLVLDLFEQSCTTSLLTPKERRCIVHHFQHASKRHCGSGGSATHARERHADTNRSGTGSSAPAPSPQISTQIPSLVLLASPPSSGPGKRKRGEDADNVFGVRVRYAQVLSVDYLLRFFVALPSVLQHYDRLGGDTMPAYCKAPMWDCLNAILALLERESFTPVQDYVLIH